MAALSSELPQSPYYDQPLGPGEIRLLTIKSNPETNLQHVFPWLSPKVTFCLVTQRHKLEENPEFDALSYVWGTASASIRVPCNNGSLLVTPTAYEMLKHLRVRSGPFWIDAICINQDDSDEKATQIPLMRQIYANATYVVIWMGAWNHAIQAFMSEFARVFDLAENWQPQIFTYDPSWRGKDWPRDDDKFWEGLYYLLDHEWFRRLWTFQEVVLAKKAIMLCGSTFINADDFFWFVDNGYYNLQSYIVRDVRIFSRVPGIAPESQLAFQACQLIRWRRSVDLDKSSTSEAGQIPGLIYLLRFRTATEHVDRVWAITGLLNEDIQHQLAPMVDYSDQGCKEYWLTFVQFAIAAYVVGQSLSFLQIPPSLGRDDTILPSWCPDLSKQTLCEMHFDGYWNLPIEVLSAQAALILSKEKHEDKDKDEDKDEEGDEDKNEEGDEERSYARQGKIINHSLKLISVASDNHILHTRGFVVDIVSEVIEDTHLVGRMEYIQDSSWNQWNMKSSIHAAAINHYNRAVSLARRMYWSDVHTSKIPLQYFMCIAADGRVMKEAEKAYLDAWNCYTTGGQDYFFSMDDASQNRAWTFLRLLVDLTGHSFFATQGGRFGIATSGCKPGDKVCTFYGGEPLYILRWPEIEGLSDAKHGDEPAKFRSAAFIPHLMEQYQRDLARLGEDEIFNIK
jgi:hypothetical protein